MTKRFSRFAILALTGGLMLMAVALVKAPYLPALAWEGYPSSTWPARGHFAWLGANREGPDTSFTRPPSQEEHDFDPQGAALFKETGGRAFLIHHEGHLRFERYGKGFDESSRLNSYSLVKSLIGLLVLRALSEDRIGDLSDPIGAYLPETLHADVRGQPIFSFLQMRSGIVSEPGGAKTIVRDSPKDVDAYSFDPFGAMIRLHMKGPLEVAPSLRIDQSREDTYDYQNVNSALLGLLLEEVYQRPLHEIVEQLIWRPAGANPAPWRQSGKNGPVTAYCCVYATPRDWMKVGVFVINNGTKEERLLPEALWEEFFGMRSEPSSDNRYGMHAYHDVLDRDGEGLQGPFTYFFGRRGQTVYLMPEEELVVVRFGEEIQLLHSTLYAAWRTIHPTTETH